MTIPDILTFNKVDGVWTTLVNPDYLFYMQTTQGVPQENTLGMVNTLSKDRFFLLKIACWKNFVAKGNVSEEELELNRKEVMANKPEAMEIIEKIFG